MNSMYNGKYETLMDWAKNDPVSYKENKELAQKTSDFLKKMWVDHPTSEFLKIEDYVNNFMKQFNGEKKDE